MSAVFTSRGTHGGIPTTMAQAPVGRSHVAVTISGHDEDAALQALHEVILAAAREVAIERSKRNTTGR